MLIDQAEIDNLLSQATAVAAEPKSAPQGPAPPACAPEPPMEPQIRRLLHIRVPVIVRLARRKMSVGAIRKLAPGAIIEFDQSVDADLDLLVNNHPVAAGLCVKVGERFGIRLRNVRDRAQRIQSLGA